MTRITSISSFVTASHQQSLFLAFLVALVAKLHVDSDLFILLKINILEGLVVMVVNKSHQFIKHHTKTLTAVF